MFGDIVSINMPDVRSSVCYSIFVIVIKLAYDSIGSLHREFYHLQSCTRPKSVAVHNNCIICLYVTFPAVAYKSLLKCSFSTTREVISFTLVQMINN